jgi:hypothetical protein
LKEYDFDPNFLVFIYPSIQYQTLWESISTKQGTFTVP